MIDRSLNYGRPVVRRFLERARPFRSVLDIGAGTGVDLLAARTVEPTAALHAIEVFPPNVAALRAEGVEVTGLDLERDAFPFAEGTLDVVIANQILEHVKEVFWVFHELTRVLRVGGSLIIGVPNLAALHNRVLLAAGRQPSVIKTASAHVRGFTRHDLVRFLDEVFPGGYVLRDHAGANFYPFPGVVAKPLATIFPNLAWGLFLRLEKRREAGRAFLDFPATHRLETNFYTGGANVA